MKYQVIKTFSHETGMAIAGEEFVEDNASKAKMRIDLGYLAPAKVVINEPKPEKADKRASKASLVTKPASKRNTRTKSEG